MVPFIVYIEELLNASSTAEPYARASNPASFFPSASDRASNSRLSLMVS